MDLLEGLNEPQRRAVTHQNGPLLIFAGAGSGKTRTLTHRIAWLINQERVPPARILAVTFTNKASREMGSRLENLIGPSAKRMWLGTFHALCAKMLRIHGERIGLNPRFAIFDMDDQLRLMKSVVKDSGLDSERFPPARALGRVSDAKNSLKTPDVAQSEATKPHEKVYAGLYATYQGRLRAQSALDFDDLLMEAVRLLKESPETLEHWRGRFLHVLIDEFQDVNEAQFQWAQLLASEHRNICVVGDDDQCLAAGTMVTTPDGEKKIEDVKEGDLVLSGVGDGETRFCEVKEAKATPYHGPILRITTASGHQFRATPNHICFAYLNRLGDRPKKRSVELMAFSHFDQSDGGLMHYVSYKEDNTWVNDLDSAEKVALQMANSRGGAEIERFAGFGKCKPKPFQEPEDWSFRFRPAAKIKVGMHVPIVATEWFDKLFGKKRRIIKSARVTSIDEEHYDGLVYDLDVPQSRNFAANGVLVHNSIYAWRGADVKLILQFEKTYPDAQIVRLEQNYRSTQNILDAAHGVISNNLGRAAKRLWTEEPGGEKLVVHGSLNAQEEALWVVRQIETLRREEHLDAKDFAILCRINAQSRPFEEAFLRARLPLKLVGTQRFYERREIRDVLAYLKFLYNPDDSVALTRLINVPPRGIGAATIAKLEDLARHQGRSLGATLLDSEIDTVLTPAVARKIAPLRRLLTLLFNDARASGTLADVVEKILERTQFLEYLDADRDGESVDRAANVEELVRAAEAFDLRLSEDLDEAGETTDVWDEGDPLRIGQFLSETALEGGTDKGATDDATTLMTFHAAKGLEFPVVFLVGVEQGLLPHARAVFGENASDEDLEEERRLMYVGLTRAEKRAYLTFAAQRTLHGRTETTIPSQFLDEIPAQLLKREGVAAGGSRWVQQRSSSWGSRGRDEFESLPRPSSESNPFGAASSTKQKEVEPPTFSVGDKVKHGSYGEGLVVAASSSGGAGEWVEVAFLGSVGKKKLIVSYANLVKV